MKQKNKMNKEYWLFTSFLNSRMLCICLFVIFPAISYAQDHRLEVTTDFEIFDIERFNQLEGDDRQLKKEILSDGTMITYYHMSQTYSCLTYPQNSNFGLSKRYYLNRNIKSKGLLFTKRRFEIGTWYFFDEAGNLTEENDYDAPYKFTLEDMLEFTRQQGVDFPKTPDILEWGKGNPQINRGYDEKTKTYWWELSRDMDDDLYKEVFRLDGETGEVYLKEIVHQGRRLRYETE